ncbi:acetyl-CoA carboxylase [Furfurilactobacillus sp. WILCCON 0119]|uniref:acetyl-CoA carboxylase n=1 Tax=Furfurilactobacillus entadae TaxID=2922307 RepID=UPI0035E8CCB8
MIDESRLIYERIEPLFLRQPHTRYWILVADDPYDKQYNFFFNSLKQGHRERSVPLHSVTDYQLAYLEALIAKLRLRTKLTLVFLNFQQQRWPESQRLIERRRHPDEAR